MVEKITFDVESDWGGRGDTYFACEEIVPRILILLKKLRIHGLFFLSRGVPFAIAHSIESHGHSLGSHGKYHTVFPSKIENKLNVEDGIRGTGYEHWRAPKFCHEEKWNVYSVKEYHYGILKYMWFGGEQKPIFYAHPFDFYEWKGKLIPPSLFCRLWYSQPKRAWRTFENLLCKST